MRSYWLFRLGSFLAGLVPLNLGYRWCEWAAAVGWLLARPQRRHALRNLRQVFGTSRTPPQLRGIGRGMLATAYKNYFELLRLPHVPTSNIIERVRMHGIDNLDQAQAEGRGVVMVSAHLGSFESSVQVLGALGYDITIPVEPIRPQRLFDLINSMRSSHGIRIVEAERGTMRTLVRTLASGNIAGFPLDRDVLGTGREFEFFGRPAPLQPAAATLARYARCRVVPAFAIRRPDNRTDLYIEEGIEMVRTADAEADLLLNMRRIMSVFERYIEEYPDQWVALVPVWQQRVHA